MTKNPELFLKAAHWEDGGDSDTRDIAQLGEAMEPGDRMKFAQICDLCAELGLFERFTNDQEDDGTLSRKARSAFPKALKPYDGRTVAKGKRFQIDGKGHSKRYLIQEVAR